jgi:uncharacterized repeat protein (TIGR03803 family)
MKGKFPLAIFLALLAASAYAAGQQPVAVNTFICNGNSGLRIGNCPNGGRPDSLIQASDGNFYGAAQDSMEGSSSPTGGTVFSLTAAGKFTLLHTFAAGTNKNYLNGNLPGFVAEGSDGKIYGTTLFGGVGGCNGYCGSGVLYRVSKTGTGFQVLHKFCSQANCADGGDGVLVAGKDGNLYGASYSGGTGTSCGQFYQGCGTIFRVTPSSGAYKVVFNFDYTTTGAFPSGLVLAADGTFFGLNSRTTGENLFHYTPATGALQTFPVNFPLVNGLPSAGGSLALGPNGNFYGLYHIYAVSGEGLFEVQPDGSHLQLFPFYTTREGGGSPDGLVLATDGNFWVADYNGNSGYGDIVSLSPADGTLLQTLTPFSASAAVGAYPLSLMQAKDGSLWGSTDQYGKASAGHFADGTVFSLNAGLPPR